MPKQLIFILGGARSGKSAFAEGLARQGGRVLYVATAQAFDEAMERRIAAHQEQRPSEWGTLEEPVALLGVLPGALEGYDTCLLDCATMWVSNMLLEMEGEADAEQRILAEALRLLEVYERSSATWIVVSNEVGLGVVPSSALGGTYRDILGRVNQALAARADKVYFMVAGLALEMKALGALPLSSAHLSLEQ